MKTLKEFMKSSQLDEALNDYQKKIVDNSPWATNASKQDHDKVFGVGNSRIVVPYDESKDVPISTSNVDSEVGHNSHARHVLKKLSDHGYHTDDYQSGLVYRKDTPNRKIKINKAMDVAGFGDDLSPAKSKHHKSLTYKQAYETDPMRSAKGDKQLVFSRNKEDVAGMSTDRGWRSCMTLPSHKNDKDAGINHRFVPHDLEHGTLTAYITRVGDDKAENPIGRVNIKQFQSLGARIYRAESSAYGTFRPKMKQAISNWAENNYPSKPGIYMKHPALYDDDGNTLKIEKPGEIQHGDNDAAFSGIREYAIHANRAAKDRIDNMKDGDYDAVYHIKTGILNKIDKLHKALPPATQFEHQVHLLTSNAIDNDEETPHDFDHKDYSELRADDYLHQHALTHGNPESADKAAIKNMQTSRALELHSKIHDAIHNTNNPESFPVLSGVHNELINHIMRNGTNQEKGAVIGDMTNGNDDDQKYYGSMMDNHHTIFDNHHPAELTTHPRQIHQLLNTDIDHFPVNEIDDDVVHHVAEHADDKLIHEMWNGDLSHHIADNRDGFIKSLSDNPHGERLQHEFTQGMLLTGGHNTEQHKSFETQAVHRYELKQERTYRHDPTATAPELTNTPVRVKYSTPVKHHLGDIDAYDSADDVDKYAAIAQHTKFKSVFDKLKTRQDIKDIPAIQNAIKSHKLFESKQPSIKTMKQFLAEADQASKRSITGDAIKAMDRKKKKELGVTMKPSKEKTSIELEPTEQELFVHDVVKKE